MSEARTVKRADAPSPLYVRVSDAQEVFGLHRATIYRQAKAGAIRIYKRGGASLLSVAEMRAWIEGRPNDV